MLGLSAMRYPLCHGSVAYTLLFLLVATARGQTTTRLPAAPSYSDGVFSSPNTFITQIFDQGTELNITWTTTYASVNLYLIFGADYGHSMPLTLGTTNTFFTWTVNDSGNNSLPFSFRAVNALGTLQQQATGGFYTGQFWVRDDSADNTVATTGTSSQPSAITTTTTTSGTSSPASGTSSGSTMPSTASTSSTGTSLSGSVKSFSSVPSNSPSISSTAFSPTAFFSGISASETGTAMKSPAQTQTSNPGPSTGAIAGIVIGAVAVLAIIIGMALYFRRQRRPSSPRHSDSTDRQMVQKGRSGSNGSGYTLRDSSWDSSRKGPAELHEHELVELPNYRSSRQHELP